MKHAEIKPTGDKILVKQAEPEKTTKGGLFIPEIASEAPSYGTVIAVGPGKKDDKGNIQKLQVKAGDKIYFTKNATVEVMHNGAEHLMMKEERVLLIEC